MLRRGLFQILSVDGVKRSVGPRISAAKREMVAGDGWFDGCSGYGPDFALVVSPQGNATVRGLKRNGPTAPN
jgi:hypothetical protein